MRVYTTMPATLVPFFDAELRAAKALLDRSELSACWKHYERAHIIGQKYPYQHSLVHWRMLCFGIRIKNSREIVGQIPRLLFGGIKSFVGHVPVGNTGGADAPPLRPMIIPDDLQKIIDVNSKDEDTSK